ncbi:hypothetical protein KIN20_036166 [Parelaphostrongylus tenuis]|uniref:Renin receptor-like C-terminal transmembrane spanning segment domain-containing protein n=1 Tax=Parelaphostrongylus tenuis TaxID=148309 RepID=A0AAD5RCK1_PARTN|nr:hypothetical protein KIN20_036166 [Parelaphostrongylus tenuis]
MISVVLLSSAIFTVVLASELQFVALPSSVKLAPPSGTSGLRISQLPGLNANLLGLTAKPIEGFEVKSDLFERPMAVAVVMVMGVDSLKNMESNGVYALENDGFDSSAFDEELARSFGSDRQTFTVTDRGITGSLTTLNDTEQEIADNIKTKLPVLREELQNIYRLAATILVRDEKFEEQSVPDVYHIRITGLPHSTIGNDRETGINDIRKAIQIFSETMSTVYGNRAVVEVLTISGDIKSDDRLHEQPVVRRKRATDSSDTGTNLKNWREALNVYAFVGTDYPAIFAIFAGLSIIMALAVLYTVVAMMSMDPSKDSIIYRMTTTRMKKA